VTALPTVGAPSILTSMPELPEVETTRRHLAVALEGESITAVDLRRDRMARRNHRPADVTERLTGRTVSKVGRLGKFIVIDVEGELKWVIHLGMSGRICIVDPAEPLETHANLVVDLTSGDQIRLVDPRTFGFVAVWTPEEWEVSTMTSIGRDALDDLPSAEELTSAFANRTAPIKALLLDQRIVAGLGNIYADEVLFRAGVHPRRAAGTLTRSEIAGIHDSIGPVLEAGIQHGGTSLDDLAYLLPDGRAGEYLSRLRAYGRTGQPCPECGTAIERTIVAQRSSHYCPRCQT
jgi:formamidopyrimidine-DNA glycosylase